MTIPLRHKTILRASLRRPPRRLRIVNKTRYDTGDLRRLIIAALEYGSMSPNPPLHVDVIYESDYCGAAVIGADKEGGFMPGNWMLICMPEDAEARRVAQILEHEVDHLIGLEHDAMPAYNELPVKWADGLTLRKRKR